MSAAAVETLRDAILQLTGKIHHSPFDVNAAEMIAQAILGPQQAPAEALPEVAANLTALVAPLARVIYNGVPGNTMHSWSDLDAYSREIHMQQARAVISALQQRRVLNTSVEAPGAVAAHDPPHAVDWHAWEPDEAARCRVCGLRGLIVGEVHRALTGPESVAAGHDVGWAIGCGHVAPQRAPLAADHIKSTSFEHTMRVQRLAIQLFETAPEGKSVGVWADLESSTREAYYKQARAVLKTF